MFLYCLTNFILNYDYLIIWYLVISLHLSSICTNVENFTAANLHYQFTCITCFIYWWQCKELGASWGVVKYSLNLSTNNLLSLVIIASKVVGSQMDHLRAGTEFWRGEILGNIFQYIFLERQVELTSNSSRFIFFGVLKNKLSNIEVERA